MHFRWNFVSLPHALLAGAVLLCACSAIDPGPPSNPGPGADAADGNAALEAAATEAAPEVAAGDGAPDASSDGDTPMQKACLAAGPAQLVDFFGDVLPGVTLMCAGLGQPIAVRLDDGTSLALYAFGTGPAPITTYGGTLRECENISPGYTACYSTNPVEAPSSLRDKTACGFPTTPVYAVACAAASCTGEVLGLGCASAAPDTAPDATYVSSSTTVNVGGALNEGVDFETQVFPTKLDFTASLPMALRIVHAGRIPVLGVGGMLLDADGLLTTDASAVLNQAIADYPSVFHAPGLMIEAVDEPFWSMGTPPTGAALAAQVTAIQQELALLAAALPDAKLGVTVAPVWNQVPTMLSCVEALVPGLQWVATDVYTMTLNAPDLANAQSLATEFAQYVAQNHPQLARFLIIQGFGPVHEQVPSAWSDTQVSTFEDFMTTMAGIGASQYSGVLIWGWNYVNELPDRYAGKHFPAALQTFYTNAVSSY